MIRIDLTTSAVTVEGDGIVGHLITVRTLQTEGSSSRVALRGDGPERELAESIRSRQGANVLREYDIDEPGDYTLTSGRRELQQNRTFLIRVERLNEDVVSITVQAGSAVCSWVIEDIVHNHHAAETFTFNVQIAAAWARRLVPSHEEGCLEIGGELGVDRATSLGIAHIGVPQGEGKITKIESDEAGVTFKRSTVWERLLEDDGPDSV